MANVAIAPYVGQPLAPYAAPGGTVLTGAGAGVVTPSDATVFAYPTRGLYIGGTGNVTVSFGATAGAAIVTFTAVPVGTFLPIAVSQVRATGTTATLIIALN
jgi:hypothetical protein